jgi:hypothetical protein
MWIVEIISSTSYNLYDSYSQGHSAPLPDTQMGGSYDLKNIRFSYVGGVYTITFDRLLKTNDQFDYEIVLVKIN